jgi:hypothetical protein
MKSTCYGFRFFSVVYFFRSLSSELFSKKKKQNSASYPAHTIGNDYLLQLHSPFISIRHYLYNRSQSLLQLNHEDIVSSVLYLEPQPDSINFRINTKGRKKEIKYKGCLGHSPTSSTRRKRPHRPAQGKK